MIPIRSQAPCYGIQMRVKAAAKQLENMMPAIVEWFSTELD